MIIVNHECHVARALDGIHVAPFYGCHYFKIHGIKDSKRLEELINLTGANSIEYIGKNSTVAQAWARAGTRSDVHGLSLELTFQKCQSIADVHVNCVVDICPFCHYQLDQ